MEERSILQDIKLGYRVLTLNRPQRLNAFTEAMHEALAAALTDVERGPHCRALMITGAGRAFSSGQDLGERMGPDGAVVVPGAALERHYNPLVRRLRALPFPVVAAVNGTAAGAGCNIALACDIVLAARSASFVQSFAGIGLVPDSGGTWHLPRLVGWARARGLALTAEPLTAERAADWGLIWRCVKDEELLPQAHALCVRFAEMPARGLELTKRALDAAEGNDLAAQLDLERRLQSEAGSHPDYAEGVRAFLAKRKPDFSGGR